MAEFISNNVEELRCWAADFAAGLRAPVTVALHGDLGMGKSEIARAIIQTLCGADTVVPSPNDITLIEWPDVAAGMLPPDTIHVYIDAHGDGRRIVVK